MYYLFSIHKRALQNIKQLIHVSWKYTKLKDNSLKLNGNNSFFELYMYVCASSNVEIIYGL